MRMENTSISHGMTWPDNVLTAVAQAASLQKPSTHSRQPAMSASRAHALAHEERERDRDGRQWLGAVPGGACAEIEHLAAEAPVGVTSAPVSSPRPFKSIGGPGAGAKAVIGYTGKDALVPQAPMGVKQIGLCLPARPESG